MYRVTLAICRGLMEAEGLLASMSQVPLGGASMSHPAQASMPQVTLGGASMSHLLAQASMSQALLAPTQDQKSQETIRSGRQCFHLVFWWHS